MSYKSACGYFWYVCDGESCVNQTPIMNDHLSPDDDMRAWKVEGYQDVHLCPKCREKHRKDLE